MRSNSSVVRILFDWESTLVSTPTLLYRCRRLEHRPDYAIPGTWGPDAGMHGLE